MRKKNSIFSVLYLWVYMLSLMVAAQNIPLREGMMLDMDEYGEMTMDCMSMALSDFYSKHDVVGAAAAGDTPASPKGWVVPTNGKKLSVGEPMKAGFTEFVRVTWNADNSTKVKGFCIDVFDQVMAALPYGLPYEYIPFARPDHPTAGDYNNLTYQVYLANYDILAGDVTIVGNRSEYGDFIRARTDSDTLLSSNSLRLASFWGLFMIAGIVSVIALIIYVLRFISESRDAVEQSDPESTTWSKNAWLILKPLTWELWLTSFFLLVLIGALIWILLDDLVSYSLL